jgi:hypothetical protein
MPDCVAKGSQPGRNSATDAIKRSRAVDLIGRTLRFTDWQQQPDDDVERVAVRLFEQIGVILRGPVTGGERGGSDVPTV